MRVRQYQLWGYKTALEVASVKTKEETEDAIIPHLFLWFYIIWPAPVQVSWLSGRIRRMAPSTG